MIKKLIASSIIGTCALLAGASCASAQVTTVVIDVDPIFTLQCISPLQFDITADQLSTALTGGVASGSGVAMSAGQQSATASGSALSVTLPTINQPLSGDLSRLDLERVACRISATPGGGRVQVSIVRSADNRLRGPNGSQIRIRNVRGRVANSGNGFQRNFRYDRSLHDGGATVSLEIQVRANLNRATTAGFHSSNNDENFTIEVTTP